MGSVFNWESQGFNNIRVSSEFLKKVFKILEQV